MSDLKTRFGPAALITGAGDGIGRAFAEALAAEGLDLVLVARRETVLQGLARDLAAKHGVAVQVIAVDLSAPGAVTDLLARTAAVPIGLLVASAGFGSIGPFLDLDAGTEANMVDLNCRSVVELTHGLATRMAAQGKPSGPRVCSRAAPISRRPVLPTKGSADRRARSPQQLLPAPNSWSCEKSAASSPRVTMLESGDEVVLSLGSVFANLCISMVSVRKVPRTSLWCGYRIGSSPARGALWVQALRSPLRRPMNLWNATVPRPTPDVMSLRSCGRIWRQARA